MPHYIVEFLDADGRMTDFIRVKKSAYKTAAGIEKAIRRRRRNETRNRIPPCGQFRTDKKNLREKGGRP